MLLVQLSVPLSWFRLKGNSVSEGVCVISVPAGVLSVGNQ